MEADIARRIADGSVQPGRGDHLFSLVQHWLAQAHVPGDVPVRDAATKARVRTWFLALDAAVLESVSALLRARLYLLRPLPSPRAPPAAATCSRSYASLSR